MAQSHDPNQNHEVDKAEWSFDDDSMPIESDNDQE